MADDVLQAEMANYYHTLQELFGDEASEALCNAIGQDPMSFTNDPRPVVSNFAKAVFKYQNMQVFISLNMLDDQTETCV